MCVRARCLNLENREPENNVLNVMLVRSRCSGIQVEKGKKGAIPLFIFAYSAICTYLGAMESSQMYKYHLIVNVDRARAKHRPITIDVPISFQFIPANHRNLWCRKIATLTTDKSLSRFRDRCARAHPSAGHKYDRAKIRCYLLPIMAKVNNDVDTRVMWLQFQSYLSSDFISFHCIHAPFSLA